MPIYEYECKQCGEKFELMRRVDANDREIACPKCGTQHPRRHVSLFSSGGGSDAHCTPAPSGGG